MKSLNGAVLVGQDFGTGGFFGILGLLVLDGRIYMGEWEEFSESMGWSNSEEPTDKVLDLANGNRPNTRNLSSAEERAYTAEEAEELRLASTPLALYAMRLFLVLRRANISESFWDENGSSYKSMTFNSPDERYKLIVIKRDETSFSVEYSLDGSRGRVETPSIKAQASGDRLTRSLFDQVRSEFSERLDALIEKHKSQSSKI